MRNWGGEVRSKEEKEMEKRRGKREKKQKGRNDRALGRGDLIIFKT